MNSSPTIGELAKALVQAQAEMPSATMNTENKFIGNKYADLGAVIQASRPVLQKHGLCIAQFPTSSDDGKVGVRSILMHISGEWIEDTILIDMRDIKGLSAAQVVGVFISYLRRYSRSAILSMYSDEDNDGEIPKKENKKSEKKTESNPTLQGIQKLWDNGDKDLRHKFKELFNEYHDKGNPYKIDDENKQKELLDKMNKLFSEYKPAEKAG